MSNVVKRASAGIARMAFIGAVFSSGVFAQEITLSTTDGNFSVVGELLSYEDNVYTIRTSLGPMKIAAKDVFCDGDACPSSSLAGGTVMITGSDAIGLGAMPLLLSSFAGEKGGVIEVSRVADNQISAAIIGEAGFGESLGEYFVETTSSTDAFGALLRGDAQIGMSSRRILPAEARALRNSGAGNMIAVGQENVIAVDSISAIVHPSNPINGLTLTQLDLIYSGNIGNWAELGGPNAPITVYARGEGSGTAATFENRIFANSGRRRAGNVRVVETAPEMVSAVFEDPNAIGYVGAAFVRGTKALNVIGECGIVANATEFNTKAEEYPLQRRMYLYNPAEISPEAVAFVEYVMSEQADEAITKSGFTSLGVTSVSQDNSNGRMRHLIESTIDPFELALMRELLVDMFNWDRLSTTFRFASGSSRLDGKGQADLDRLINYLERQPEGTQVALVGFTDGDGAFDANRALSIGRAEKVASAIASASGNRLDNVEFFAKGFGEMAPAACNDTLEGKRINRRVEVWVRKAS